MKTTTNEIRLMIPEDCWFEAPSVSSQQFFPVFQEVALHLYEAIRAALPALYFRDAANYVDTKYALPMLTFQASQPFRPRSRNEFSYDVLNLRHMNTFFRNARKRMFRVLADARCAVAAAQLSTESMREPAYFRKVLKDVRIHRVYRKPVNQMLVVEGRLMEELVKLSACGNFPVKARAKYIANFNHNWGVLLRRFCGSFDFTETGEQLLQAATVGLKAALRDLPAAQDTMFDRAA